MSNHKLGRKALALGALTGLGLSFLGAAPAVAAPGGTVSLLPANGTGYGALENVNEDNNQRSNVFTLKTTISSDVADFNDGELKYKITSDGSSYADFYVGYGWDANNYNDWNDWWYDGYYQGGWSYDNGSFSSVSNARLNSWSGSNGVSAFYDVESEVVSPNEIADYADGNDSDYGYYETDARHTVNYLSIGTFAHDHNVNVTVTAFIDTNNNNTLDTDEEVVSAARTINFYKPSAITQTTTWVQPVAGDTSLTVHTAYSPELNEEQITDAENFTEDTQLGTSFAWKGAESVNWQPGTIDYSVDTSDGNSSSVNIWYYGYADQGDSFAAKPWIDDYYNETWVYGAEVYAGVRSDSVNNITLKGVYSADEYTVFATENPYTVVRAGKTANIDAAVYSNGKRAAAGIPVTVTLHDNDLEADSAVSAGGKTLTAGGDDVSYDTVTDANGHVAIAVTGGVASDDIAVTVEYGNDYYSDTLDVSWQKATANSFYSDKLGTCDDDQAPYGIIDVSQAVTRGSSVSIDYILIDQFGQPYAGTDYRVRLVSYGEDATVDSAKIVNGKASFTFTDASTAINPDFEVLGHLEKIDTDSQNYVDQFWYVGQHVFTYVGGPAAASISANQSVATEWYDSTDAGVDSQIVSYNDFAIGDFRGVYNDNPAFIKSSFTEGQYGGSLANSANGDKQWIEVNGVVRDANNVPVSGAKVTLSGKGLLIGSDSYSLEGGTIDHGYAYRGDYNGYEGGDGDWRGAFTGLDNLTVYADDTGYYEVHVASHTAGATDLTISAAGKTTTTTLHYVTAIHHQQVQNIHAAKVVTSGNQSLLAGTSTDLTSTVTDKFGNVLPDVQVKYAVSGNATIAGWTDDTNYTDDKGQVTAKILAGSNDIGTVNTTVSLPWHKTEVAGLNSYLNNNWNSWYYAQYYLANGYNDFGRLNWLQPAAVADQSVVYTYGVETAKVLKTSKRVVTASWSFAKGKSVLVVVDGYRRYHQTELSNAENSFSKKLKKGKHTISIYINGLLLDRLVTTIK